MQSTSCFWNERPVAIKENYANADVNELLDCYEHDNRRLHPDPSALGLCLPPPPKTNGIRICQWNINGLSYALRWTSNDGEEAARAIANVLLETNADVLILNEFGGDCDGYKSLTLTLTLEKAGYTIHVAPTDWPTAVATRLPSSTSADFQHSPAAAARGILLDEECARGAVAVTVPVKMEANEQSGNSDAAEKTVVVYGTHLEAWDGRNGRYRLENMSTLLEHIQKEDVSQKANAIIIAGDFNQQRQKDYTEAEWQSICANKKRRGSPPDDGVASMLNHAGFQCSYDKIAPETKLNWQPENPPPSTHWTGTIVDYSYRRTCDRDTALKVNGIYVSPCSLSDHRLIVTDWGFSS